MESKCFCQQCGEHIAFDIQDAGQPIDCPHCGHATILTAGAPPAAAPSAKTEREKIDDCARLLQTASGLCFWLAGVAFVGTLLFLLGNNGNFERCLCAAIFCGVLNFGLFLLLIAQVMYIRVNTMKE